VVERGGDVRRRAGVLRVGDLFPEHLAVAHPHRFRVAELVDDVGDAAGDGRRELDQRVGVDRPGFAQRRVEALAFGRQIVGPLGDAAEERPVDQGGIARGRRACASVAIARVATGGERQAAGECGQK
jgi:hypothetical protein